MSHTAGNLSCSVIAATKTDTVLAASKMMKEAKIGCVVVIEGGKVVGIFSERDLLNRVVTEGKDPAKTPLFEVMTTNPVKLDVSAPLQKVFAVFAANHFRHIPVTELGRLVGIVSLSDVARILSEVCKEEKYVNLFAESLRARGRPPAS